MSGFLVRLPICAGTFGVYSTNIIMAQGAINSQLFDINLKIHHDTGQGYNLYEMPENSLVESSARSSSLTSSADLKLSKPYNDPPLLKDSKTRKLLVVCALIATILGIILITVVLALALKKRPKNVQTRVNSN